MALFGDKKSGEDKKIEKMQKIEQKQNDKLQKLMNRYHLEDLDKEDLQLLENITSDLAGNGLGKAGMIFSFAKTEEIAKVTYLSALVEQNWMIIRQLAKLNKNLENLNNK